MAEALNALKPDCVSLISNLNNKLIIKVKALLPNQFILDKAVFVNLVIFLFSSSTNLDPITKSYLLFIIPDKSFLFC